MIKVNLLESVTDRARGAVMVEEKVANPRARLMLLAVSVFALMMTAMLFDYLSANAAHASAEEELARQRQIAAQMAAVNKEQAELEKKIKDIETRIEAIKMLRSSQQGPVSLLSAINERLPDAPNFRLENIEQKNGELTIEGHSMNEYAVTQFGRSLEFSSGLFQNVSIETERREMEIKPSDYDASAGPIDTSAKPETVRFKIKCKFGQTSQPAQPSPGGVKKEAEPKQIAQN